MTVSNKFPVEQWNMTDAELAAVEEFSKSKAKPLEDYFSKEENRKHFNELFAKAHQEQINQRLSKPK